MTRAITGIRIFGNPDEGRKRRARRMPESGGCSHTSYSARPSPACVTTFSRIRAGARPLVLSPSGLFCAGLRHRTRRIVRYRLADVPSPNVAIAGVLRIRATPLGGAWILHSTQIAFTDSCVPDSLSHTFYDTSRKNYTTPRHVWLCILLRRRQGPPLGLQDLLRIAHPGRED